MTRSGRRAPDMPLVGAHVSIAGGIEKAPERGLRLGCRAIQIFTKPASRWAAAPLSPESCRLFRDRVQAARLHVVAHDAYLINLGSPQISAWKRSKAALADELERCALLGVGGLVVHPGAHMGSGEEAAIRRIARGLREAHGQAGSPEVRILLENTAGQGTTLGHRFEHLAAIAEAATERVPIGFCLDTCHAFAAGYNIARDGGLAHTLAEWDRLIGLHRLGLVHVNDSKRGCGARVDRHELIGQGEIGRAAFRALMADRRLEKVPKILETPKGEDDSNDRQALALLRRYATLGRKP